MDMIIQKRGTIHSYETILYFPTPLKHYF